MPLSPWKISLISTGYDMPDIRADLGQYLTENGFNVIAYERPDFPVEPHVHSHEACLLALNSADIVILVVDRRYGGLYLGAGDISITEKEYITAVEKGKIVIPCIRKAASDERHYLFETAKQLRKHDKRMDVRKVLKTKYVDNWDVLDFIEKVKNAARDNFVITFEHSVELKNRVKGRLQGLSHWLLLQLVKKQALEVKNIKTTTFMAFSLGDVLDKGYFVQPPYKVHSGPLALVKDSSRIMSAIRRSHACVAVLGDPGSGKSTLLGKAFLDHAKRSLKDKSPSLPFFVPLRGRGHFNFSAADFIEECFATLWQKEKFPLLVLDSIEPTFYMDGLDEMSEGQPGFDVAGFCGSTMFKSPFMLSCRSRFASEFVRDTAIGNRLSGIIELQPWGKSITSKYTKEFCEIRDRRDLLPHLKASLTSGGEMNEIATNPLLLTLFLYLVEENNMQVPLDIRGKRELFSKTLEIWAHRELSRLLGATGVRRAEELLLLKAWRVAAWYIYCFRFTATPTIRLGDLFTRVNAEVPEATSVCQREAFHGLFDVRAHSDEVTGAVHEQLLEELVAELLCEGMRAGSFPFPGSLGVAVRWEINQLIRSIWTEAGTQALQETLTNLAAAFHSALPDNSDKAILRRNQAAYYMGRLDIPEAETVLREADALETNLFVKLSLGFGLMKRLQFDVENEVVEKLRNDSDWDTGNRGYHLHYYHDWQVPDMAPLYKDPGNIPWTNTLHALLRHIESPSIKHVALRRVELLTLRRLIETRAEKGPMTVGILERIESAVKATTQARYRLLPAGYKKKLMAEWIALKEAWMSSPKRKR